MKFFSACLFCIVSFHAFVCASESVVVAEAHFSGLQEALTEDALLVLDIDDTLIHSKTTLGNPACYYQLASYYLEAGYKDEAIRNTLNLFDGAIQKHAEFELCDERILKILSDCQARGIPVVALTNRPPHLADITPQILDKVGIHLEQTLPIEEKVAFAIQSPALFHKGILFVGDGNAKADVLDFYIEHLLPSQYRVRKVVFADDKKSYVRQIQDYAERKGFDFFGLNYIKEKERQRSLKVEVAIRQIEQLFCYFPEDANAPEAHALITPIDDPIVPRILLHSPAPSQGKFYLVGAVCPDAVIEQLMR